MVFKDAPTILPEEADPEWLHYLTLAYQELGRDCPKVTVLSEDEIAEAVRKAERDLGLEYDPISTRPVLKQPRDQMRARCHDCGYSGTRAAVLAHTCPTPFGIRLVPWPFS